jgi:predicted RNase H-like HicB family nuclease
MSEIEVWKEHGVYAARIPSLHINTQAKTLKELKKNLKEAIEVTIEGLLEMKKPKLEMKATA